jgi:hypothetical protein
MLDFLLSSSHSNCKSLISFLYIVTFMLFSSKVISSRNPENFLSYSAHCVNSTDNPSLMDFSTQIDWTGWIEGDSACVVGESSMPLWDKMGCSCSMPICNHSSGLWKKRNVAVEVNMPLAVLCVGMCHDVSVSHLNSHGEGQTGESLYETQKWNSPFPRQLQESLWKTKME